MPKIHLKNDKYRKSRGGHSRFLAIRCEKCGTHLFYYQKDGLGILKRAYLDRIIDLKNFGKSLSCPKCNEALGVKYVYPKEKRLAYKLFVGCITKKIVNQKDIK